MSELTTSKVNPEPHLLLDQPLLKVPYEIARKNHKNALRYVERERESVLDAFKKIANSTIPSTKDYRTYQNNLMLTSTYENTTLDSLEGMIAKMETLKRKLEGLHAEERMNHKHTKARIKHLEDLHNVQSVEDQTYNNWAKIRLDRFLVNYMLQSGYANSAKALAAEVGIEELVDIDVFLQYDKIRNSLENGSIQEALIWCAENKSALKKINSELEYELRLQQYIELVRTRQQSKLLEATAHARKYLVSIDDPHSAVKAAGLLAYPPGTPIEPYKSLFSRQRYSLLASRFMFAHHSLLSLGLRSELHTALGAGLSALKTPSCHSAYTASSGNVVSSMSGNSVCPICSTELNELARPVPYAMHSKSSVEGEPVVLPNGRMYGRGRLMALNEKMEGVIDGMGDGEGKVRDPVTGETWNWSEVRKVYIM